MRKIKYLTEEKTESTTSFSNAMDSAFDETILDHEQSIFQDVESFLRTKRVEEGDIKFIHKSIILILLLMRYHQASKKPMISRIP